MDDIEERYSRHLPLRTIGKENQLKLANRKVLIAGMGGLGTVSAELLASIGVGYLRIVDYDVVEKSNLPRQKLYDDNDIGKAKVDVAEIRLKQRNPNITIDPHATRIDALSAPQLLDGIDLIVDGLDTFSARKALFRVAHKMKIPYVFAGSVAEQGNVMTYVHGDKPCMECVLGSPGDDRENSCEVRGVHPAILSIAASTQVSEAIKVLLDQTPALSNEMLYIDLIDLSFDKIGFAKKEDCKICGTEIKEKEELDTGKAGEITRGLRQIGEHGKALVTSLCGRDTIIIDPNWEINWNFDEIREQIREHYHIAVTGNNYITLTIEGAGVSLLSSGVTTIRGAGGSKGAIPKFERLLSLINQ